MIAYDLHPQARLDLDEIWEFIRGDNLDAADKVIADIFGEPRRAGHFPPSGPQTPGPHITPLTIHFGA